MRNLKFAGVFFGLAVAVLAGFGALRPAAPAAAYPGGDNLTLIGQGCDGFGNVTARFNWQSYNMGDQWLDVSQVNANFDWDSFYGHGPFTQNQNATDRGGLAPNSIYYVRVNTAVFPFWVPTNIVAFQTMNCAPSGTASGSPLQTCDNLGNVTARFNWQPVGGGEQWLDMSTIGANFDWGTFFGEGPFTADRNTVDRGALLPNTLYYVRINTAVFPYWVPSPIFSFRTISCTPALPTATPVVVTATPIVVTATPAPTMTPMPTSTPGIEPTPPH